MAKSSIKKIEKKNSNYDEQTNKHGPKIDRRKYIEHFRYFCVILFVLRKYAPNKESAISMKEVISHVKEMTLPEDHDDIGRTDYRMLEDFHNCLFSDDVKELGVICYQLGGCVRVCKNERDKREKLLYFQSFIDDRDIELFNLYTEGERNTKPSDGSEFRDIRNNKDDLKHLEKIQDFLMPEKNIIQRRVTEYDYSFYAGENLKSYAQALMSGNKSENNTGTGMFDIYYKLLEVMKKNVNDRKVSITTEKDEYPFPFWPLSFRWEKNELVLEGKGSNENGGYDKHGGKKGLLVKNIKKIERAIPEQH
jgi:hypothetical protein